MASLIKLPMTHQTMFAELTSRCMDASFDQQFPENGSFLQVEAKGRAYWYYSGYRPMPGGKGQGTRTRLYVGPVADPDITSRVSAFANIKANFRERRQMVQSLAAAGLPSPTGMVGNIVEELWKGGFFRLRGVLIGTLSFQTYCGYLGVRMPNAVSMTGDADFAQFHSISAAVGDEMPPILDVLHGADPTFRPLPHLAGPTQAAKFRNKLGFEVEFLTPNRGSEANQGKPSPMPALGGASAEPLRFLDYLIFSPVRSVLLHKGGIPVNVPAPERYAVHKLIVCMHRKDDDNGRRKAEKDLVQTSLLFEALELEKRTIDIGFAWMEAWGRGVRWQHALSGGRARLGPVGSKILARAVSEACEADRKDPSTFGYPTSGVSDIAGADDGP
jgi:hypothetical protein